jgi:hypothetical protein
MEMNMEFRRRVLEDCGHPTRAVSSSYHNTDFQPSEVPGGSHAPPGTHLPAGVARLSCMNGPIAVALDTFVPDQIA